MKKPKLLAATLVLLLGAASAAGGRLLPAEHSPYAGSAMLISKGGK